MMCQLLYIGWVRKRLIKEKSYSSACNISASLSGFTPKIKITLLSEKGYSGWRLKSIENGQMNHIWYIRYRSFTDISYHYFIEGTT